MSLSMLNSLSFTLYIIIAVCQYVYPNETEHFSRKSSLPSRYGPTHGLLRSVYLTHYESTEKSETLDLAPMDIIVSLYNANIVTL